MPDARTDNPFKIWEDKCFPVRNSPLFMLSYSFDKEKKIEADDLERIEIASLRKAIVLGYTQGLKKAFSNGLKISLTVNFSRFGGYIYLDTEEGSRGDIVGVQITLDTSCSYLGGYRHWFLCPGKGGKFCNERVGTLYLLGSEFACRHCHDLTYKSRNLRSKFNRASLRAKVLHHKAKVLREGIKRWGYAKKPTKNALRYQRIVALQKEAFTTLEVITETLHQRSLKKKRAYHRHEIVTQNPRKIEGEGVEKEAYLSVDGYRNF